MLCAIEVGVHAGVSGVRCGEPLVERAFNTVQKSIVLSTCGVHTLKSSPTTCRTVPLSSNGTYTPGTPTRRDVLHSLGVHEAVLNPLSSVNGHQNACRIRVVVAEAIGNCAAIAGGIWFASQSRSRTRRCVGQEPWLVIDVNPSLLKRGREAPRGDLALVEH